MAFEIKHGDCLEAMRGMADNSVDAIVTDPPYGLVGASRGGSSQPGDLATPYGRSGPSKKRGGFMGKEWDASIPGAEYWSEALRIAKPGAYILAFGGTRTFHRLAVAIEDAGWEMRDTLMWVYGSGFPKSHNVAIGIDKANGAPPRGKALVVAGRGEREDLQGSDANPRPQELEAYAPSTEAAKQWQGWGTALKPAWEPIIMARKPLEGTVAQNVLKHGTGAINVDGCRVDLTGAQFEPGYMGNPTKVRDGGTFSLPPKSLSMYKATGRWPANVIHDGSDEVVGMFPETTSGTLSPGHGTGQNPWTNSSRKGWTKEWGGDTGSAARYFYTAKASKEDRDEGLRGFDVVRSGGMSATVDGSMLTGAGNERTTARANHHPCVKPTDLMRYLCRLVTPPGGTVFDPFMGSGSTGKAAVLEGFSFIGCDLQAEYVSIAKARCAWAEEEHFREHAQQSLFPVDDAPRLFAPEPVAPARQTSIEDAH